ncbi:MAG TPA: helix-turn-helix domain-containing protein [Solirubrobacteraceae bacterium]|nr:helix-turn-helix domain-containing protein [Solirubrobacteraceae bacterium]
MLGGVGVAETEERVYRSLVRLGAATAEELVGVAGVSDGSLHTALAGLEEKGLASRVPGAGARFVPAPPDVAIEALAARRYEEVARARLAATELTNEFRSGSGADRAAEVLEVVTGSDAVRRRFAQLQRSAVEELLVFDKPPYTTAAPDNEDTEHDILARGVRCRVVYDRSSLTEPGQPRMLESLAAAGEDARVAADVPMKLVICDRRLALTPLSLQQGLTDAALVVHRSGLLDALAALFESVWQRAIPVPALASSSEEDRRLLMMLASGLKDEAIARQLGIGERTLRRRIAALADRLGARTRFQLGIQAVRQRWL